MTAPINDVVRAHYAKAALSVIDGRERGENAACCRTDEMLALAARNTAEAGAANVEFLKGEIEATPLPADSIDVVISNCVINLAADKSAVFREIARVLRPGGRVAVADIVAEDSLTPTERTEGGSYVGCIAGAQSFSECTRRASAQLVPRTSPSPAPTRRPPAWSRRSFGPASRRRP